MTAYLGTSADEAERFGVAVSGGVHFVASAKALDEYLGSAPGEQLVVVGPQLHLASACAIAEQYRTSRPALGVVLIRYRPDVATLGEAMRSGVREVVAADDAGEIAAACRRSQAVSAGFESGARDDAHRGRLITVFASKGGCGKTTVSTNLGAAFASMGLRTCIVDLDLQFGDVAIALQLEPIRSISDALGMTGGIDAPAASSLVVRVREGLDVLLAPPRPAEAEFITADIAGELLEGLLRLYDVVVVDAPPAFNDVVLRAFDMADEYVLITTLDMPSLKSLRVTLDTLDTLGYPRSRWNMVLNRSDSRVGLTPEDVERAIGMRVPTRIPSSSAVPASINQGVTLFDSNPRHPVSRSIRGLADGLRSASVTPSGPPSTARAGASRRLAFARRG